MNSAAAVVPDPTDVCVFGHQLAPGSDPIVIKEFDADGRKIKEETLLLRRHALMGPGGVYSGGRRMTELDQNGQIVKEWVEGGNPQDHGMTPTRVDKVVAYPCAHALPEAALEPDELPALPFRGGSYGRAHWLTYKSIQKGPLSIPVAMCPVCRGEDTPADWRS